MMKTWFACLVASLLVVVACSYAWTHRRHIAVPAPDLRTSEAGKYAEEEQAGQLVTVTGPMADYMSRKTPANVETSRSISQRPSASDHVVASPVGSSAALLHKTFSVTGAVDLSFELPAHATSAKLRGTYQSFWPPRAGQQAADDHAAEVEFLLMNEQQFSDFRSGRPDEPLFATDAASNGEVNFTLPPTFSQPAKYYLVFRNSSRRARKRVVRADFRIDF